MFVYHSLWKHSKRMNEGSNRGLQPRLCIDTYRRQENLRNQDDFFGFACERLALRQSGVSILLARYEYASVVIGLSVVTVFCFKVKLIEDQQKSYDYSCNN